MSMKLTMKEPYSKAGFFSVRIRAYIDLVRPFTLLAPFFVSMFIMAASLMYNHKIAAIENWFFIIPQASLTLAFLNAASNALNQATDAEADAISKPYRPIPRGVVTKEEAISISFIFYLFALLRAITINLWFGLFVFLIMMFTVTYSLPPRMKQYLFINQLWIAIPRGFLGILASWSVFGDPFTSVPIVIGFIAMVFFIGGMTTKDIVDSEADKRTGTHTLVNTYGVSKAALISFPFLVFPFTMVPIFTNMGLLKPYMLPLVIFSIPSFLVFFLMFKHNESQTLENIHAWSLMYVVYLFYAIIFSTLIMLGENGLLSFI
jgi:4-hydroxybenzoate polyprenyltransferase